MRLLCVCVWYMWTNCRQVRRLGFSGDAADLVVNQMVDAGPTRRGLPHGHRPRSSLRSDEGSDGREEEQQERDGEQLVSFSTFRRCYLATVLASGIIRTGYTRSQRRHRRWDDL